jgi:hypothetical protein
MGSFVIRFGKCEGIDTILISGEDRRTLCLGSFYSNSFRENRDKEKISQL